MKSKEELYKEIEELKEINLVDFACLTYGFRIDQKRTLEENGNTSNPRYVFLENDNGDKLLVSRVVNEGRQQYLYKNLYNDLDKGNIFSFLRFRSKDFTIQYAKKRIYNFVDNIEKGFYKSTGVSIELKGDEIKTTSEASIKEVQRKYQVLPSFIHKDYLKSRGLSEDLLNSYLCKNRIKNEYIYYPRISSSTKPAVKHINTVFPIYGSDGTKQFICGYVRKNENMKLTAKESKQSIGVWTSDYKRGEQITHFVLAENPIDALSYCQMKLPISDCNPLLAASNGELSKSQLDIYQEIVTRLKPETIILANDNNCKGQLFNAKILASLALPDKYTDRTYYDNNRLIVDSEIHCGYKDKYTGEIIWRFKHDKMLDNMSKDKFVLEHIPQFQRVVLEYEKMNKDLFLVNDEKYPFTIEKKFDNYESQVKVSFHNLKANWVEVNKSILSLKFDNNEALKLDLSKHVDWNDDLKDSLGIQLKKDEKNTEGVKHKM